MTVLHMRFKKISAILFAIGVLLSLTVTASASGGATDTVNGREYRIISSKNLFSNRLGDLADDPADAQLFDMSGFSVLYPGEGREAILTIDNDSSYNREVVMTIRATPDTDPEDIRLNEVIDLKVERNGNVIFALDTTLLDSFGSYTLDFTPQQVSELRFFAVIRGGKVEIQELPPVIADITNLDERQKAYNARYMGAEASFQVIFTWEEVTIEPTTAPPPPPTVNPGGGTEDTPSEEPISIQPTTLAPRIPTTAAEPRTSAEPPTVTETGTEPTSPEDAAFPETNPPVTGADPYPDETQTATAIPTVGGGTDEFTDPSIPLESISLKENPKTGEADPFGFSIAGIGLMLAGGCVMAVGIKKNKNNREEK